MKRKTHECLLGIDKWLGIIMKHCDKLVQLLITQFDSIMLILTETVMFFVL